jgi:ethanolamine utilization protein EutM
MIETWGFTPAVVAVDTGMKAAPVNLLTVRMTDPARMTVAFTGDVAAVGAVVSAASTAAARVGRVIATRVIARPGADLLQALSGNPGPEVSPPPAPPVTPDTVPQPLETPESETAGHTKEKAPPARPKPQPSSKPAAAKKQAPKKKPKTAAKRKPARSPG